MFRKHFNVATAISVVALVFAMAGGAYAAKKFLITSTKQISPSVLKALAGKAGAKGAAGPAGAQGLKGEPGAAGKEGPQGKEGVQGKEGPAGPKGATGAAGPKGATGEPWTAGGTLPSGKTETGTWTAHYFTGNTGEPQSAAGISFPIPLAAPSAHVHYLNPAQTKASIGSGECEFEASNPAATPIAPPDTLCVFALEEEGGTFFGIGNVFGTEKGDSPAGTTIWATPAELNGEIGWLSMRGVWAVTAK